MRKTIGSITMDQVFTCNERDLHKLLVCHLKASRKKVVQSDDFVFYQGSFPVLLVAHMDTVHRYTPTICKSSDGNVWMAPEGIGGDDRCGIWAVLNLLEKHDVSVLFTHGEETGATGARAFAASGIVPVANYMVELDRQGCDDAVFYQCGNQEFESFVTDQTGFIVAIGSFSDISVLSPVFDLASVNLSIGYYSPHSNAEFIRLDDMDYTINMVDEMLKNTDRNKVFRYEKRVTCGASARWWKNSSGKYGQYSDYDWDVWDDETRDLPSVAAKYESKVAAEIKKESPAPINPDGMFLDADDEAIERFEKLSEQQRIEDDLMQAFYDETSMFIKSLIGVDPDPDDVEYVSEIVKESLIDLGYWQF